MIEDEVAGGEVGGAIPQLHNAALYKIQVRLGLRHRVVTPSRKILLP